MPPVRRGIGQRVAALESRLAAGARRSEMVVARYRDNFNRVILLETLERAVLSGVMTSYHLKGASAIELRFGSNARATRDIDLELAIPLDRLTIVFAQALAVGYDDFTFAIRGEPRAVREEAVSVTVSMKYLDRHWATLDVDLAPATLPDVADDVPIARPEIAPGLGKARTMKTAYIVAQKLHAVTRPDPPRNYARHVVDIVMLDTIGLNLAEVRAACEAVFLARAERDCQAWPPTALDLPPEWENDYQATLDTYPSAVHPKEVRPRFVALLVQIVGGTVMPGYEYRFHALRYRQAPTNPQEAAFGSPIDTADSRTEGLNNLAKDGWRVQTAVNLPHLDVPELLLVLEREIP